MGDFRLYNDRYFWYIWIWRFELLRKRGHVELLSILNYFTFTFNTSFSSKNYERGHSTVLEINCHWIRLCQNTLSSSKFNINSSSSSSSSSSRTKVSTIFLIIYLRSRLPKLQRQVLSYMTKRPNMTYKISGQVLSENRLA